MKDLNISHSAARYLQAIHKLSHTNDAVRQIDVARYLDVKPSSCFSAILGLMRKGHVKEGAKKFLTLSKEALEYVRRLAKNDSLLADFFVQVLGMKTKQAEEDAKRIEYTVSEDLSLHLCKFLHFWKENPDSIQLPEQVKAFKLCPEKEVKCQKCPFIEACQKFHKDQ